LVSMKNKHRIGCHRAWPDLRWDQLSDQPTTTARAAR
jgi:hypothetical protein